jgi:hypothetical protein
MSLCLLWSSPFVTAAVAHSACVRVLLLRAEREREAWHDERQEKDRQEPLSGASEANHLALGTVKGQSTAGVSTIADLEGVMSRFDWYLDRVVHFERSDLLTVDYDIEGATTDLCSERFVRKPEGCCHVLFLSVLAVRLLLTALNMKG